MHPMIWTSRAVSSPFVPLGGNAWRQIGQISPSRRRGRDEGEGRWDGDDDDDS